MVTQATGFGPPSEFADDVLEVVDQIPAGKVMTYGDIAELLGRGGARGVGSVMARYGSDVPWWRVLRAGGWFPQGLHDEALAHYLEEGTPLVGGQLAGRRVDLTRARWTGATHPDPQQSGTEATHRDLPQATDRQASDRQVAGPSVGP